MANKVAERSVTLLEADLIRCMQRAVEAVQTLGRTVMEQGKASDRVPTPEFVATFLNAAGTALQVVSRNLATCIAIYPQYGAAMASLQKETPNGVDGGLPDGE